jgi:hypothetical protein
MNKKNACNQLKEKFNFLREVTQASGLVGSEVTRIGDLMQLQQYRKLLERRINLFSEYQDAVCDLLDEWVDSEIFRDKIIFGSSGEVVINGGLHISDESFTYFPKLIHTVTGDLNLEKSRIKTLDNLVEVGSLKAGENTTLAALPSLETVNGDLLLGRTAVSNLPKLKRVKGCLNIFYLKNLKKIPLLSYVGGLIELTGSGVKCFPKLETVDKGILMRDVEFSSFRSCFPSLRRIGQVGSISLLVSSRELEIEIEDLVRTNQLEISGDIQFKH